MGSSPGGRVDILGRMHTGPATTTLGADIPPATRMLLRSDGSTTRLLEALLDRTLSIEVIDQYTDTAAALSATLRELLGCARGEQVVRRHSALVTGAAVPVSRNEVTVLCRDQELAGILTDDRTPIGHGLAASRHRLRRAQMSAGFDTWLGDIEMPCVYKEYLLVDACDQPVAHLNERFHPQFVPPAVAS